MGMIYRLIGAVALATAAWLLHAYYIDYQVNARTYVFSWTSPPQVHDSFIESLARLNVRPERKESRANPYYRLGFPRHRDNPANGCRLIQPEPSSSGRQRVVSSNNPLRYWCERPWLEPPYEEFVFPAVTLEDALIQAKANHPSSRYGMTPSLASAGPEPGPSETSTSLWLGVLAPLVMILGALAQLLSIIGPWRRHRQDQNLLSRLAQATPMPTFQPSGSLTDILKVTFGDDFPIDGGDASRDSPLVITEPRDYVAIEYAVARFLLGSQEWKKLRQNLLRVGDAFVDELVFAVRDDQDGEWKEHSFFFDITMGYGQRR